MGVSLLPEKSRKLRCQKIENENILTITTRITLSKITHFYRKILYFESWSSSPSIYRLEPYKRGLKKCIDDKVTSS